MAWRRPRATAFFTVALPFVAFARSLLKHRVFTTPNGIDAYGAITKTLDEYAAQLAPEAEGDPPWFLSFDGQDAKCFQIAERDPEYPYTSLNPDSGLPSTEWVKGYSFLPEICVQLGSYRKAIREMSLEKPAKPAWWKPKLKLVEDVTKTDAAPEDVSKTA